MKRRCFLAAAFCSGVAMPWATACCSGVIRLDRMRRNRIRDPAGSKETRMRMPIITAVVLVGFILAGCSGLVPNVPVKAPAGYTAAQVAADEKTCAKSRSGQEHKDDFYTACNGLKGLYDVRHREA